MANFLSKRVFADYITFEKNNNSYSDMNTLKSLIEEHAHIDFSDFLSTLLAIFYVINEKFHPARLLF